MNRFSFVIILIVLAALFQTANAGWTRTYGGENLDKGYCVQQTSDGDYIVIGKTESFGGLWLLKVNKKGDTLWTRIYEGLGASIQQTDDNGYIITGSSEEYDLLLLRTDPQGSVLWTRTYGGDSADAGHCVMETYDRGFIIAGFTNSFGAGNGDLWLLKTDSVGDTVWARIYGGKDKDCGTSVVQTTDSGYVVTGIIDHHDYYGELYLLKTDAEGNVLWTHTYGGENYDAGNCVEQTSDGGYIIGGWYSTSPLNSDVWLLKTDSEGDFVWERIYGEEELDDAYHVQQTKDGGYIITGVTVSFGEGLWDLWLLKTDENGDTVWTRSYGGEELDWGLCVQQTEDGGYIIIGSTESFGAGESDLWLIKTNANGDTLALIEEPPVTHQPDWQITPIGSQIVFRYSDRPDGFHASIFDAAGRKVDELHASGEFGTITWGKWHRPGVYFIVPSEGKVSAQKVVLVK